MGSLKQSEQRSSFLIEILVYQTRLIIGEKTSADEIEKRVDPLYITLVRKRTSIKQYLFKLSIFCFKISLVLSVNFIQYVQPKEGYLVGPVTVASVSTVNQLILIRSQST